jgi:DNA-binding transcriptional LysR family regulator
MAQALRSLDWSLVQAFVTVAEAGSLSAAARRLGQSQPTLGRQVQAMEQALGTELFRRQPRGMALTEAGRALLDPARAMQEAAMRLSVAAAGEEAALAGTVRITASVYMAHYVLPPIIAGLRRTAPEIAIELAASDSTENLLFREADIAVRMYRPEQLDVVTRQICEIPLGLFGAISYLDRRGRPRDTEDLLSHDFVGYDSSEQILRGMRAAGMEVDREWFPVRCDNQSANWELVRAGCGLGFGQRPVGRADPGLEEIPLVMQIPPLPVWLAAHEKVRRSPRVARVWDALAEGIARLVS